MFLRFYQPTPFLRVKEQIFKMDIELIKRSIEKKGIKCLNVKEENLKVLSSFLKNPDIKEYLMNCLTIDGFSASGLAIKNLEAIQDEIMPDVAPGGFIAPYSYLVIATSIGGNAVCLDEKSSSVYWADHSHFFENLISYEDKETGEWIDLQVTPENVKKALIPLSNNIQNFLIDLFEDKLKEKFETLD
jgi:hypothetical protein